MLLDWGKNGCGFWTLFWVLGGGIVGRRKRTKRKFLTETTALSQGLDVDTFEPRILLSSDLIPVAGEIELPGETDLFQFELAEARTLTFDALTNRGDLTWSLDGVAGNIRSPTAFNQSDANYGSLLALDAGTYTISVDGTGDATGDYRFRLLNVENGAGLTTGLPVSGTLEEQGRETDVFRFDVTAGTDLYFDAQTLSGGSAYWRLYDPEGQQVFSTRSFSASQDVPRLTAQKTGVYTLLLEGVVSNTADTSYTFTVEQVIDRTDTLTVGALITDRFDQPGQTHSYTFTLADDENLLFDAIEPSNVQWSLTGPEGTVVSNRYLYSSDWSSDPLLDLVAGDYTLTLRQTNDNNESYGFRLLSFGDAQPLTLGETLNGVLTDAGQDAVERRLPSTAPGRDHRRSDARFPQPLGGRGHGLGRGGPEADRDDAGILDRCGSAAALRHADPEDDDLELVRRLGHVFPVQWRLVVLHQSMERGQQCRHRYSGDGLDTCGGDLRWRDPVALCRRCSRR